MAVKKALVLYNGISSELQSSDSLAGIEGTANKDASGGYAGLTLFKINFKNALNTFTSFFTNTNTAARTYTFQDKDHTVGEAIIDYTTTNPTAPTTGIVPFARFRGGRRVLGQTSPIATTILQPSFFYNRIQLAEAQVNTTTFNYLGLAAHTVVGTASARGTTSTDYQSQTRRIAVAVVSSTAPATGSFRNTQVQWWRGNAAGFGGFYFSMKFGIDASVTHLIYFFGLNTGSAITSNTNPSTLINIIGVGKDTNDTNMQLMYNDGSGTATKVDLGVSIGITSIFCLRIFCLPNDSNIYVSVEDLGAGTVLIDTTLTSDIPSSTTFMSYIAHLSSTDTNGTPVLVLASIYAETNG